MSAVLLVIILFAALTLTTLIAPPEARAGSATFTDGDPAARFSFEAMPGETNHLTVRHDDMAWTLRDASAPLSAGPGCMQTGEREVRCPTPRWYGPAGDEEPELDVRITTGDGDDVIDFAPTLPAPSYGSWEVMLEGGIGEDRITTHSRTRFIIVDGGPGDDALRGGPSRDLIVGGAGLDDIDGGPGADSLWGDAGPFHAETPIVADDVIVGGPGDDTVEFLSSTRVQVDLADPAPDGSAGEADELRRVENVRATSSRRIVLRGDEGPNRLDAYDASTDGRQARPVLVGGDGDDWLVAGARTSRLDGGRGDDRLHAIVSGSAIRCGPGDDAVNPLAYREEVLRKKVPSPVPRGCEWIESDTGVDASLTPMVVHGGRVRLQLRRLDAPVPLTLRIAIYAPSNSRLLARGRVDLGAGRAGSRTVFIRLTAAGRRALGRRRMVVVRLAAPRSGVFAVRYRNVVVPRPR